MDLQGLTERRWNAPCIVFFSSWWLGKDERGRHGRRTTQEPTWNVCIEFEHIGPSWRMLPWTLVSKDDVDEGSADSERWKLEVGVLRG